MKNLAFFFLLHLSATCGAQQTYWQQKADVTIDVQLNDREHTLDGFEKIQYTNNSPDTLRFIWFHLWPNAYKNDRTAFSDQMLTTGKTAFYFASKEQRGYINRLDFKVDGVTAKTEDHPEHIDIIKLLLPTPLAPLQQAVITTPFHVKLPFLFSRSGYHNGTFQVTQWYPKPAVYDVRGWHPMPYLDQGEFYSEFGDYDVKITVPQEYAVAATGVLHNKDEQEWLRTRNNMITTSKKNTNHKQRQYGHLKKSSHPSKTKTADTNFFKTTYPVKTLRFMQQAVHDFAWVASKNFQVDSDTCRLPMGKIIEVYTYYTNKPNTAWKKSLSYAKDALRFYSAGVGDYPYATMHVAESAVANGGGMEYPTLTIVTPTLSGKMLDIIIAHEIGHNWFYGALATNERDAPWLDEGLNTFYEKRYTARKYGDSPHMDELLLHTLVKQKRDQPITTGAPHFSTLNYGLIAYNKTARWLGMVEQQLGYPKFQEIMQEYYSQWRFRHPQDEDFKKFMSDALPDTSMFRFLYTKGALPNQRLSNLKIISPFLPGTIKAAMQIPPKNRLFIMPVVGYNRYDRFMIGGLFTNYGLPPTSLQYIVIPLYATGSKSWNGIGNIKYSLYKTGLFDKIDAAISGMGFSKNQIPDSNGTAHYERFYKIAPSLRFTFKQPLQSTRERWLEWKTFFIGERNFSKFATKASDGLTYVDSLANTRYYTNQLTYQATDYRALYPYRYQLQLQQGWAFYRININGETFFNYATGGGAGMRLFFSKFGYLGKNQFQRFATTRFQPKLLGNTGVEDYTYGSYFVGRTASYANDASVVKNNGLAAQQILLRDGAFKLRMDAFDFLQGRSENWVAALNFNTTLPRQLWPLPIPLKLFFDVGTYAEAKESENATSRILYVAGLQLPLFKNALTIHAPFFYSSVFRDNLKTLPEQNTFFKRLTFSIDFNALSVQRLTRNKFSL